MEWTSPRSFRGAGPSVLAPCVRCKVGSEAAEPPAVDTTEMFSNVGTRLQLNALLIMQMGINPCLPQSPKHLQSSPCATSYSPKVASKKQKKNIIYPRPSPTERAEPLFFLIPKWIYVLQFALQPSHQHLSYSSKVLNKPSFKTHYNRRPQKGSQSPSSMEPLDQVSIIETNKNYHIYPTSKQQGAKLRVGDFWKHLQSKNLLQSKILHNILQKSDPSNRLIRRQSKIFLYFNLIDPQEASEHRVQTQFKHTAWKALGSTLQQICKRTDIKMHDVKFRNMVFASRGAGWGLRVQNRT